MTEFNIRTDSVDVEQIMRQIRARIKEKRGVDYTEQQIQELANIKLERFLDPKGVRSDLVEQFKRTRSSTPEPPKYTFEDSTIYDTHRGMLRFMRRLLNPLLKLLFNPNPLIHVIHVQAQINALYAEQFRVRDELDALYYETLHNLVLELTRVGIENKNVKMRLESLSSRMDFDERRARALEGVVQYKPGTGPAREPQPQATPSRPPAPQRQPQRQPYREPRPQPQHQPPPSPQVDIEPVQNERAGAATPAPPEPPAEGASMDAPAMGATIAADGSAAPGTARRRRRRRRGRRGGRGRGPGEGPNQASGPDAAAASDGTPGAVEAHPAQSDFYDTESDGESGAGAEADEGPEPSEQ
jgi:hypothetical protein